MGVPSWKLHPLSNGLWAISVNGNWRMTFAFEGGNASIVDYVDYH
jgi:proteic killer suppression protein